MTVRFKVAMTSGDYRAAHALARQEGFSSNRLNFPTVMAFEDGELVGLLGTNTEQKLVLTGPLVMKQDKRRHRLLLKLIDVYDELMRQLGIKSYIHAVDRTNKKWLSFIERVYKAKPYAEQDGCLFFVKEL